MSVIHNKSTGIVENFDEEELKTIAYLKNHKPELETEYLHYLQEGRRGIFQRLCQALIREQLIKKERITWSEEIETNIFIELSHRKKLQIPILKRHSLARFDIGDTIKILDSETSRVLVHPIELLELIREEGLLKDSSEFQRFKLEIQNGVANLSLALAGAAQRKYEILVQAKTEGIVNSLQWVNKQMMEKITFSPLAFYEQCVVEGHPLHPGAKTKFGLEVEDVIRYSPEWGGTPEVALAAVSKDYCQTTSMGRRTVTSLLYQEYEGLQSTIKKTLQSMDLNPDDFELIPVHPWQFEHTLGNLYREEIEQKKVVLLSGVRIATQSLVSFRSLAPFQRRGQKRHHIKTAVNVQTTSAIRTVSPNSVENGPVLSKILGSILEKENRFNESFVVLGERAGTYFQPTKQDLTKDEIWTLQANLATILRENPENYVYSEQEIPMAAAALIADSPLNGKPIVVEMVEELARHKQITNLGEAASIFIKRYAERSLPGFLTLMVRYGISLEGHMQNSIPIFRNGELIRILLRDFGGIRVLPERLMKQGFQPEFYPGSSIVTEKEEQLRNIISYSVMQNHFAELITCLVRALDIDEKKLWSQVASVCKVIFSELKKDPKIVEQATTDEQALFQPTLELKALTTMRLRGDSTNYSFIKVPNPLLEEKGENLR